MLPSPYSLTLADIQGRSVEWKSSQDRLVCGTAISIVAILVFAVILLIIVKSTHPENKATSPSWYVMPLKTNLTERTTGLSAKTINITSNTVEADISAFTDTVGRGMAWTSTPGTMVVLPTQIGSLAITYSYTFYFQLTAFSHDTPCTAVVSSADYRSPTSFRAGVWSTSQYHGSGITPNTLAFFQGVQDAYSSSGAVVEEAYYPSSCLSDGLLPAQLNVWTHIAVVNTAGTLTYDGYYTPDFSTSMYVNGNLSCAQSDESMLWEGSPSIQLGYLSGASNVMSGYIQCLTWADFALSEAQVLESMTLCD